MRKVYNTQNFSLQNQNPNPCVFTSNPTRIRIWEFRSDFSDSDSDIRPITTRYATPTNNPIQGLAPKSPPLLCQMAGGESAAAGGRRSDNALTDEAGGAPCGEEVWRCSRSEEAGESSGRQTGPACSRVLACYTLQSTRCAVVLSTPVTRTVFSGLEVPIVSATR